MCNTTEVTSVQCSDSEFSKVILHLYLMTQRDGKGREVGGGFRMGNTCKPMADCYQCMAKKKKKGYIPWDI